MSDDKAADCGAKFAHDAHLYRTERGKAKACDGVPRHLKTGQRA